MKPSPLWIDALILDASMGDKGGGPRGITFWDIVATNSDGSSGRCSRCLQVNP